MTTTWKEVDANFHLLLDAEGEVVASVVFTGKRWALLDAEGEVVGEAITLGGAKDLWK